MFKKISKDCKEFQCLENDGPVALTKECGALPRVTKGNERLEKNSKDDENGDTVGRVERSFISTYERSISTREIKPEPMFETGIYNKQPPTWYFI